MRTTRKIVGKLGDEDIIEVVLTLESNRDKKFFSMAYYLLDYRKYKIATLEQIPNTLRIKGRESEVQKFLNDLVAMIQTLSDTEKRE